MATLDEIRDLLAQQGDDWREANRQLIELVRESTSATSTANELNRDLKTGLSKIKRQNLYGILTQLAQIAFYVVLGLAVISASIYGRDFKFGDIEITAPTIN